VEWVLEKNVCLTATIFKKAKAVYHLKPFAKAFDDFLL